MRRAEENARRRIKNEDDPAAVYADLEREKQGIQDEYESKIVSLGGDIAPKAATGKPLDRNTAKQYLQKAGGDKNKAREMARKDGYSF